jgi:hypothetical protein
MLCEKIGSLFILVGKFNLVARNVCKTFMKEFHNHLVNVKVTNNVEKPSCQIIANIFWYLIKIIR